MARRLHRLGLRAERPDDARRGGKCGFELRLRPGDAEGTRGDLARRIRAAELGRQGLEHALEPRDVEVADHALDQRERIGPAQVERLAQRLLGIGKAAADVRQIQRRIGCHHVDQLGEAVLLFGQEALDVSKSKAAG